MNNLSGSGFVKQVPIIYLFEMLCSWNFFPKGKCPLSPLKPSLYEPCLGGEEVPVTSIQWKAKLAYNTT